ncbi:MBL fold metallo-hydrolase [Baekduia sp. Peel2402]|uniref:MBL fold metallo-hydrolase n=1 Tax=Baekduia sp. Peel2402 TaxID=3458296 RepID=UPI00403E7B1D
MSDGDRLRWLGHATVELVLGDTVLLTDPVLRRRVGHLQRATPPVAPPPRVDAVLLSHLHRDHLDVPSLRRLGDNYTLIVPRGARRFLPAALRARATELAVGDATRVGSVEIRAVPARHDGRRHPLQPSASAADALGFVIAAPDDGPRVYFAGDTDLFDGMARIGAGGLDVALLPVAGWGPRLGPGHLDPPRAARAAALLNPVIAVPIHWATLVPATLRRGRAALLTAPGPAFAAATRLTAPEVKVMVLPPGGTLPLVPSV